MSATTPSSTPSEYTRSIYQLISWIVAGFCAALATGLSISQIRAHRKRFSSPKEQRKIIAILWIVPIYSINSWLSLRYVHASVYIDAFRDIYEAYVLHMFLSLMYTYLCNPDGDINRMNAVLANLDEDHKIIHHLFPFKMILSPWNVDRNFLKICYRGTLQFCFFKPVTTICAVVMEASGVYNEGSFSLQSGYIYTSIVMNCSITWAAYVLLLFYLAFKKELKPYHPVPKFLCIKAILFLSFWQAVVLAGFAQFQIIHDVGEYTTTDVKTGINNLLLCVEMVLIALAHRYAFPYDGYLENTGNGGESGDGGGLGRSLLNDNFATSDLLRDLNESGLAVVPTGFVPSSKDVNIKDSGGGSECIEEVKESEELPSFSGELNGSVGDEKKEEEDEGLGFRM